MVPADSLIYLETKDLAAAIQPIADSKAFGDVAKTKPDFSSLRGIQLAVTVTGFETSEEKLTEENSIGRVQPHFAAIADTHAWNWQARNFAENKLGEFINDIYGGGINLVVSDKDGGKYYVWTAEDGRKAYAFVTGSSIFFGNDESSIDRCLAVTRGEADSIAKNPKLPQMEAGSLAVGYVSPDGIAQLSNIAGLSMAMGTGEDEEVKNFIAGVLPQLLRSSISEITWTATKTEQGIEDKLLISTAPDVSNVFSETLTSGGGPDASLFEFLPSEVLSATLYNLKDPQRAWRSVLLVAQKQTNQVAGKIIADFSGSFFEPYGIRDGEMFLSASGPDVLTAKFDFEGEKPVVIATVKDVVKLKATLAHEIKLNKQASAENGFETWKSDDVGLAAIFVEDKIVVGDAESVIRCAKAKQNGGNFAKGEALKRFIESKAAAITSGKDTESAGKIAEVLGEKKSADARSVSNYLTETRFTKTGIERRTVSDFGLIGSIIAQLAPEE